LGGGKPDRIVEAVNLAGAHPGDRVVLEVPPAGVLGGAALLYLLPATAAVAGAAAGAVLGPRWLGVGADAGATLFLVAALAASLLAVRGLARTLAKRPTFQVSIVEILPGGVEAGRREEAAGDR
jgi:positive regulator of sigma E activity